jgi:uncharacterized phiE125 gp8 family phage protein
MLVQTAPPALEPVTVEEARLFCRIDGTGEDDLLASLITASRQDAEVLLQRSLITQGWRLVLDAFPNSAIALERGVVQTLESITYLDMHGSLQTLAPADYATDFSGCPGRITPAFGKSWPATLAQIAAVSIDYTAGFGPTAADVPEGIKRWIKIRVATVYAHREEVATSGGSAPHFFVAGLLDAWRAVRI